MSAPSKPKAVIISDVHYNLANLELADASMRMAVAHADILKVPLIVAGDLHDTKALLRGECVNAMIKTFSCAGIRILVIPGNHCRINEKSRAHSLGFLDPYADRIYDEPRHYDKELNLWLVPYHSAEEDLEGTLSEIPVQSTVICHQGVHGAHMGEYVLDKSAVPINWFKDFRTISGHYHRAQDIKAGRPRKGAVGLFSYVGTPYTTSFSEANDGPKGFRVLYDNGALQTVPTNLRKHIIRECDLSNLYEEIPDYKPGDLVWIKVSGPYTELESLNKKEIGDRLLGHSNFKLDKIYTEGVKLIAKTEKMSEDEVLDALIDETSESTEKKAHLKELWRSLL